MKIAFNILLLLFCFTKVYADATPKINDRPELEFSKDGKIITSYDSLLIITHLRDADSIQYLYPTLYRSDFLQNVLYHNGANYLIDERTQIDSFQVFIIYKGNEYNSEQVALTGNKSFLKFDLTDDGKIVENHNLLYCKWSVYYKSLIITLTLEFCLIFLILRKYRQNFSSLLLTVLLINMITHFSLWFIDSRIEVSLIILELIVIIIETTVLALLFRNQIPLKKIVLTVNSANIVSWWIGSVIHWMIK